MINNIYSKYTSLSLLTIAIGYGVFAQEIPLDFWSLEAPINARTLPYLLTITGTILAFVLSVLSFLPRSASVQEESIPSPQGSDWYSLCLMLVLMATFAISIELIGFVLSSVLLLIFGFVLLGSRSPSKILLIAVPLVLLIWLLLDALGIYLAEGTIFLTTLEIRDLNSV